MDTELLRTFLVVQEHGSVSVAAASLHLTQPAVSKRIAALEQHFDTALFDRIGRRLTVTEAGRKLLPQAREILAKVAETCRALSNLRDSAEGTLAIATSHHLGLHRLPPLLREFGTRYPSVDLDIEFLDSEAAYELVTQGEIELAVITLAPTIDPRLESREVWRDPLCFVCAKDHSLANTRRLTLASLGEHRAILPSLSTYTGRILAALFDDAGVRLPQRMTTNYLETIRTMVGIGLGWSLLPETMLDAELHRLPVEAPPLFRRLGYIGHRERTRSNAAAALINLLDREANPPSSPGLR